MTLHILKNVFVSITLTQMALGAGCVKLLICPNTHDALHRLRPEHAVGRRHQYRNWQFILISRTQKLVPTLETK